MQVTSTGAGALPSTSMGSQASGRLLAADLATTLFPNVPVTGTVKSVQPGQALLDLGTTTLALRTTDNSLTPGQTITIRFQESGKGVVDLGNGSTTIVTIDTGDAPATTAAKTSPSNTQNTVVDARYTPVVQPRQFPTFSQPIIRVQVVPQNTTSPTTATIADASQPVVTTQGPPRAIPTVPVEASSTATANTTTAANNNQSANRPPVIFRYDRPMPTLTTGQQAIPNRPTVLLEGEVLVRSDGREFPAKLAEGFPDTTTGPVYAKVTTTPRGVILTPLPNSAQLPTQIASAVLRQTANRPEIGSVVQNLLQTEVTPTNTEPTTSQPTGLKTVTEFLKTLLPPNGQPPDAKQIADFVKNGGLLYEAKLAEATTQKLAPRDLQDIPANDVKGQVMAALKEVSSVEQKAPLHMALDSIESQQALNVLASQTGEGIRLQLPIWDQSQWRTMEMTFTPEHYGDDQRPSADQQGYDIFMHTNLTDFGDTYIDVQVHGGSFRSVLYIEQETARTAAKAAVAELNAEVRGIGYAMVHVEVRSTVELPAKSREQSNALRGGVPAKMSMLDVKA